MNKICDAPKVNHAANARHELAAPPPPKAEPPPRRPGFDDENAFERGGRRAPVAAQAPAQQPMAAAPVAPFGHAPSGAQRLSPNDLGVIPQDQGNTNACGTTSLANVMTHWGRPTTHQQIDRGIRAFDMFTAPDRIADFARASGMRASVKPDASMADITRMIDQGVPPIVLYDPGESNDANLHYATVSGYNRGADGNVSSVVLANSAGAQREVMPADEFMRRWGDLRLGNVSTGMHNMMITAIPNDNRRVTGGDGQVRRASSIALPQSTLSGELRSAASRTTARVISDAAVTARVARDGVQIVGDAAASGARWARDRASDGANAIGRGARRLWGAVFD